MFIFHLFCGSNMLYMHYLIILLSTVIILALFCRQVTRIRVSNSPEVTQKLMVGLGCEFRPFQLRFHAGNSSRKISIHLYSTLLIIFLTISNLLLNHSSNFFFLSHWTFQIQNFQLVFFFLINSLLKFSICL